MHTGLEEGHGGSLDAMAAFYEARAAGGAGLIVTGGVAPSRAGWVSPFAAKVF
jgi:2,4-dienoyl-CoA reductase (NADPH2)